jgi:23S rRNA (cytosine1962-C5)-methyltransferase
LVLDRYASTLVAKLYTTAWLPHWKDIVSLIREELAPDRLVLRLSRNIQDVAGRQFQAQDGQIVCGPPVQEAVVFEETGLRFAADVLRGQKTGFFLDQRENRRKVEAMAQGRAVLNVFSFSGGFSLYAARGRARSVTDIDLSGHALEAAARNFALNEADPNVRACHREAVQADAFQWLEGSTAAEFDFIVLDPPSLAKREADRSGALHGYRKLVTAALHRLRPGGILVACSCSAHVSASEFFEAIRHTAGQSHRRFAELATALQPPDHPATFPEAAYLKSIYLRFEP